MMYKKAIAVDDVRLYHDFHHLSTDLVRVSWSANPTFALSTEKTLTLNNVIHELFMHENIYYSHTIVGNSVRTPLDNTCVTRLLSDADTSLILVRDISIQSEDDISIRFCVIELGSRNAVSIIRTVAPILRRYYIDDFLKNNR